MKLSHSFPWVLLTSSILLIACAKATGGDSPGDGDGDGDVASGGTPSTGGVVITTGGSTMTGGSGPMGGDTMSGGSPGTNNTTPVSCMKEDTLPCAEVPGNTSQLFGTATCNEEGDGWDTSECLVCEPEVGTIDCVDIIGSEETYTGGTAICNDAGDGYDESECEYCGDGILNGTGEACDGDDVPSETCEGIGLGVGESGGEDLACNESCRFDISLCDVCTEGFTGSKCLETPTFNCSGTACADTQCGGGGECTMACGSNGNTCEGMSCAPTAVCTVTSGHQGVTAIECMNSSVCDVECGQNGGSSCSLTCLAGAACSNSAGNETDVTYNCAAGSICDIECGSNGGDCSVNCVSGSACSVSATSNAARPTGTAFCANATCTYEFAGQGNTGLNVVCEDGGVCDITVANNDTTLTNPIQCEAGSTCTIDCQVTNGEDNCPYMCDAAATCTCTGSKCVEL